MTPVRSEPHASSSSAGTCSIVTMNRPEARNALSGPMLRA